MSELKSMADLFEAAAKMMRMCDEAGIDYWYKIGGLLVHSTNGKYWGFDDFPCDLQSYEFPLAIVEGKPVFKGDELYCTKPKCHVCIENGTSKFIVGDEKSGGLNPDFTCTSWNPPTPKTVMVEISVEDADRFFNSFDEYPDGLHGRIARACHKALEELK